jgi:hypothetical protein
LLLAWLHFETVEDGFEEQARRRVLEKHVLLRYLRQSGTSNGTSRNG